MCCLFVYLFLLNWYSVVGVLISICLCLVLFGSSVVRYWYVSVLLMVFLYLICG